MDMRAVIAVIFALFLIFALTTYYDDITGMVVGGTGNGDVFGPAVAGEFYPGEKWELESTLDRMLGNMSVTCGPVVRALIVPHAQYPLAEPVYAAAYAALQEGRYSNIIIIGPSHHSGFYGFSIPEASYYRTPLGAAKISAKAESLRADRSHVSDASIHESEQSVETQLPFIQHLLGKGVEITPIITGNINSAVLGDTLMPYLDNRTLLIITSDFDANLPHDEAAKADGACIKHITALNFTGVYQCQMSGKTPVMALMYIAQKLGWTGELLKYGSSAETTGKASVAGYAAIKFTESGLDESGRAALLGLAKTSIKTFFSTMGKMPEVNKSSLEPALLRMSGCYVTLTRNGKILGYAGTPFPKDPLYKCVMDNSVNSGLAVQHGTDGVEMEVSAITAPEVMEHHAPEEILEKLRPGTDGVMMSLNGRSYLFLPQIWKNFPDKQKFLSNMCFSMELEQDCWLNETIVIETFQADTFRGML